MGAALHLVSGTAGPGGDLTLPRLALFAAPDDYLLETQRNRFESEWRAANPEGEVRHFDPSPTADRLLQEMVAPSLFASTRLLVVKSATPFLPGKGGEQDGALLAEGLRNYELPGVTLLLVAETPTEPAGPVAEVIASNGELRWSPLPAPPKPWEDVRVSPAQRKVLEEVLRGEAPQLLTRRDVVDCLMETYGFRPRELARAARQLVTSGDISVEAVHAHAGPGEFSLTEVEDVLACRDAGRIIGLIASLSVGGEVRDWRGERIASDRAAAVLFGLVGRLLRQSLRLRGYTRDAGLERELDPARCGRRDWYPRQFKPRIHPRLVEVMKAAGDEHAAKGSAWQAHKAFRLAAAYSDRELVTSLARLVGTGIERAPKLVALSALSSGLIELTTPSSS